MGLSTAYMYWYLKWPDDEGETPKPEEILPLAFAPPCSHHKTSWQQQQSSRSINNKQNLIDPIMLANRCSKSLIHRSAPLVSKVLIPRCIASQQQAFSFTTSPWASLSTATVPLASTTAKSNVSSFDFYQQQQQQQCRLFATQPIMGQAATMPDHSIKGTVSDGVSSSAEILKQKAGHVTKKLRVLDMDTVEKIRNELKSVDANSDGRYVPRSTK